MAVIALFALFWIFPLLLLADIPALSNNTEYQNGWLGPYPTQTFFSDPDIIAPVANVVVGPEKSSAERFVTWAPHGDNITVVGPQLLDSKNLSLVYQGPGIGQDTFGITVQTCNSTDYLVWWAGDNVDGRAAGNYYIYNSTYHLVWNVSAVDREFGDAHDVFLTPDCHLVFTVYESRPFDLAEYGVSTENQTWLLDSFFQEVDLATNELLFEWQATDHVDLRDAFWTPDLEGQGDENWHAWDFFHINSVDKDRFGNYLISARHTCAVYYIDGVTGDILWTLGGLKNDFLDLDNGRATDFSWQHHARWLNDDLTRMSLFDDRSCGYYTSDLSLSRGVTLELDYSAMPMTVRLVNEYWAPDEILSVRKGGIQVLDNDHALLGFGSEPAITEYDQHGEIVWDVRFGPVMEDIDRATADNYRAYKFDWVGMPHWSPKIAAGPSLGERPVSLLNGDNVYADFSNDTAYFSWNGATEVTQWLVMTLDNETNLLAASMVPKTGFESSNYTSAAAVYVVATALNEMIVLDSTPILDMRDGSLYMGRNTSLVLKFEEYRRIWLEKQRYAASRAGTLMRIVSSPLAFVLYCALGISAAFLAYRFTIRRGFSRNWRRGRYQIVGQGLQATELSSSFVPRSRRQFSVSSAIDPVEVFTSDSTEPRIELYSELGERRTTKVDINV